MAHVSVIGLGKVGITLAACLGARNHRVIGVDLSASVVDSLNARTYRTPEPGVVDRYVCLPKDRFEATTDPVAAIVESDVTFIIVPTPSNVLGGFSLRYVLHACDEVSAGIRAKDAPHVVAVVSTLLPGSSDRVVIPRLEAGSGRRLGQGLGYVYNPAFIALGDVVKGFEEPDYILLGEADEASGQAVLDLHTSMIRSSTPIARMSPVEAEITKIASNTHETTRVSFANMLLSLCSEVPGANVDRVTEALAHRMGRRFFKGALPYGGPCWPRDNRALAAFMDAVGVPSRLPRTVDLFNDEHGRYVLGKVLALAPARTTVGILGLAYKPGTPVIEQSFPLRLAGWLAEEGRTVIGWDPLAALEVERTQHPITLTDTAEQCLRESQTIVIGNPLPELCSLDWSAARQAMVIDCWRCLCPSAIESLGHYVPLGQGPNVPVAEWLEQRIGERIDLLVN